MSFAWLVRRRSSLRASRRSSSRIGLEQLEQRNLFAADCGTDLTRLVEPLFAPGTAAEVMAAYEDIDFTGESSHDAFNFSDSSRWSRTTTSGGSLGQGDATIITWSVADDGTAIAGYNGEAAAPSNLQAFLGSIYGTNSSSSRPEDQPWFAVMQSVFDRWSALSGVTYVYEPADDGAALGSSANGVAGVRGDVRLAGHRIDGNSNILAYNFYPTVGDMVIDTADSFYTNTGSNSLRLRNTLAHELGHGLGLGHVTPTNGTKLMEPSLTTAFDGPQADDILAVNRGYGDRLEKAGGNNTLATATPLTVTTGSFSLDTLSIDDDSDADYFRFTVGSAGQASVTLTPTGSAYTSNSTTFNSLAQSDLSLTVLNSSGTVIAAANLTAAGLAESLAGVNLPGSGTYYVRITGSANAAQMYRLQGSIAAGMTSAPEIQVLDGAADIADNTGSVNFGSVVVGGSLSRTFTIRNQGNQDLVLGPSVQLPAGFTLAQAWSGATIAPGSSVSLVVSVDTTLAANRSGSLSIVTNDSDENPFNFTISATVTSNPTPPPTTPGLPFSDSFNRTSSTSLGTNWTERTGDFAVSSNALSSSTTGVSLATVSGVTATNVTLSADVNLGTGTATRSLGLVARYSTSGDWYLANVRYTGGRYRVEIWKQIGGVQTLLSSAFISSGSGNLRFEVAGSSLRVYWQGTLVGSTSDTALASGGIGVRSNFRTGLRLDNFAAAAPTATSTAPPATSPSRAWIAQSLLNRQRALADLRGQLLAQVLAELD